MTSHLNVAAIQLRNGLLPKASKLNSPLEDEAIPMTVVPIEAAEIAVHIWWPGGLPDEASTRQAHLDVLHYLHDLMLEKSVEDASAKSVAALAATIMTLAGASDVGE
jgi:hypothetical protein